MTDLVKTSKESIADQTKRIEKDEQDFIKTLEKTFITHLVTYLRLATLIKAMYREHTLNRSKASEVMMAVKSSIFNSRDAVFNCYFIDDGANFELTGFLRNFPVVMMETFSTAYAVIENNRLEMNRDNEDITDLLTQFTVKTEEIATIVENIDFGSQSLNEEQTNFGTNSTPENNQNGDKEKHIEFRNAIEQLKRLLYNDMYNDMEVLVKERKKRFEHGIFNPPGLNLTEKENSDENNLNAKISKTFTIVNTKATSIITNFLSKLISEDKKMDSNISDTTRANEFKLLKSINYFYKKSINGFGSKKQIEESNNRCKHIREHIEHSKNIVMLAFEKVSQFPLSNKIIRLLSDESRLISRIKRIVAQIERSGDRDTIIASKGLLTKVLQLKTSIDAIKQGSKTTNAQEHDKNELIPENANDLFEFFKKDFDAKYGSTDEMNDSKMKPVLDKVSFLTEYFLDVNHLKDNEENIGDQKYLIKEKKFLNVIKTHAKKFVAQIDFIKAKINDSSNRKPQLKCKKSMDKTKKKYAASKVSQRNESDVLQVSKTYDLPLNGGKGDIFLHQDIKKLRNEIDNSHFDVTREVELDKYNAFIIRLQAQLARLHISFFTQKQPLDSQDKALKSQKYVVAHRLTADINSINEMQARANDSQTKAAKIQAKAKEQVIGCDSSISFALLDDITSHHDSITIFQQNAVADDNNDSSVLKEITELQLETITLQKTVFNEIKENKDEMMSMLQTAKASVKNLEASQKKTPDVQELNTIEQTTKPKEGDFGSPIDVKKRDENVILLANKVPQIENINSGMNSMQLLAIAKPEALDANQSKTYDLNEPLQPSSSNSRRKEEIVGSQSLKTKDEDINFVAEGALTDEKKQTLQPNAVYLEESVNQGLTKLEKSSDIMDNAKKIFAFGLLSIIGFVVVIVLVKYFKKQ